MKTPELEKGKRRKRATMKPKAPSVAAASLVETSFGVLSDNSASSSPTAKKWKVDFLETTATDMEKLKERLKIEICGGKQKEPAMLLLAALCPKFHVKQSTMLVTDCVDFYSLRCSFVIRMSNPYA